jgi:hypothetical protein
MGIVMVPVLGRADRQRFDTRTAGKWTTRGYPYRRIEGGLLLPTPAGQATPHRGR